MKTTNKILLTAFVLILLASLAMMGYIRSQVSPEMFHSVEGSGQVLEQERLLENFNGLHLRGNMNVYLYPGTDAFLRIEADDNLHDLITSDHRDGILSLTLEQQVSRHAKLDIHIGFHQIDEIHVSAGGKVFTKAPIYATFLSHVVQTGAQSTLHLYVDELDLKVQAGATANLEGEAESMILISQAGAMVYASDLRVSVCEIMARAGSVNMLYVTESISGRARQGAILQLKGNPDQRGFSSQQGVSIEILD